MNDPRYDDADSAIRLLAERLTKSEDGLAASIATIITLLKIMNKIDPDKVDQELRELRIFTQEIEAGRVQSRLLKENQNQIKILETALRRPGPK